MKRNAVSEKKSNTRKTPPEKVGNKRPGLSMLENAGTQDYGTPGFRRRHCDACGTPRVTDSHAGREKRQVPDTPCSRQSGFPATVKKNPENLSSLISTSSGTGGVNLELGDRSSRIAFEWAKKSFEHRNKGDGSPVSVREGGFAARIDISRVRRKNIIALTSDGIGTKIEIAERMKKYETLGFDLVAMVADDLVSNGFEPVSLTNILDVNYLEPETVDRLMNGLYRAAKFSRISVVGGEIAELGRRVRGYGKGMHFNWCATALGILAGERAIDGTLIRPGQEIIALRSRGFRSNGFSLVRSILTRSFGPLWHMKKFDGKKSWGEILLTPSLIYAPLIVDLIKAGAEITGIAHITGGGIFSKFARPLRIAGTGASLEDLHEPHDFMLEVQKLGQIDDETAYRHWNMGNGMLLVVEKTSLDEVIKSASRAGYQARHAGRIVRNRDITVHSKGIFRTILRSSLDIN